MIHVISCTSRDFLLPLLIILREFLERDSGGLFCVSDLRIRIRRSVSIFCGSLSYFSNFSGSPGFQILAGLMGFKSRSIVFLSIRRRLQFLVPAMKGNCNEPELLRR